MTIRITPLNLGSTQRAMLTGGIAVIDRLYLRGRLLYGDPHLSIGGIVSVRGTTVTVLHRIRESFRKFNWLLIFDIKVWGFFTLRAREVGRQQPQTRRNHYDFNPEIIHANRELDVHSKAGCLICTVLGLICVHKQKAHPLGTAVLSSSSNESTVGREADILLGERSMGLVALPFTPVVDTRLSIIIKHLFDKNLLSRSFLTLPENGSIIH